jgi:hypothetical protein
MASSEHILDLRRKGRASKSGDHQEEREREREGCKVRGRGGRRVGKKWSDRGVGRGEVYEREERAGRGGGRERRAHLLGLLLLLVDVHATTRPKLHLLLP